MSMVEPIEDGIEQFAGQCLRTSPRQPGGFGPPAVVGSQSVDRRDRSPEEEQNVIPGRFKKNIIRPISAIRRPPGFAAVLVLRHA